ncbi:MAG: serine hydrolase domain-containing protein [Pyrinomonadaceae bacterium]
MSQIITRRKLLTSGIKTSLGLIVLKELSFSSLPVIAFSSERPGADRFQAAYPRLDEFIARHMNDVGAPGMTLALVDRDGLLRASQYGFADLKGRVPVAAETLFEIGSISKSFVAIAILQLAEERKLDLHKPVTHYLPWLRIDSQYAPFTTHHLLSHTAGLSGIPLLMRVASTPLRTGSEPGTRFVYSNIGYVLLGFLLETLDKQPLADVLRKRVLNPLGMRQSQPIITNDTRERLATGYVPFHDDRPFPLRGKLAEAPWLEVPEAAGSVASTATDMGAYLRMLLNRGNGPRGRLLSEKSFELLLQPVIKAPFRGEDASYTYGLWVSDADSRTLLRHTGGMVSFSSALYVDMTSGYAAFASVNARLGGYRPVAVVKYALDLLNASARGQELPQIPPLPPSPLVIKNASDYSGTFTSPGGEKLSLTAESEQLILKYGNQKVALEQAGLDRFIVKHPAFELFALGFGREKGAVVEAFHGDRWWFNDRYSGPKTFDYPPVWDAYEGHYRSDSPWYGSTRLVIRKGRLLIEGEQPLVQIQPAVFRPEGDSGAEQIVFDTVVNGKAGRVNFSGIDFFRTFTP